MAAAVEEQVVEVEVEVGGTTTRGKCLFSVGDPIRWLRRPLSSRTRRIGTGVAVAVVELVDLVDLARSSSRMAMEMQKWSRKMRRRRMDRRIKCPM